MIDDELLAKFDRIQDLPVSEEMLGAYIEGGLSEVESIQLSTMINSYPEVSTVISEIEISPSDFMESAYMSLDGLDIDDINVGLPNLNDIDALLGQLSSTPGFSNINSLYDTIISNSFELEDFTEDISEIKSDGLFPTSDSSSKDKQSLESNMDSDSGLDSESNDFNNFDFQP